MARIKTWKVEKKEVDKTFRVDIIEYKSHIQLKLENIDAEFYEDGERKAIKSERPIRVAGMKIDGISIPEPLYNEIKEEYDKAWEKKQAEYQEFIERIEADRPAPIVDEEKYYIFGINPETFITEVFEDDEEDEMIYKEAVNRILKKTKAKMAFRGSRDYTCEFPGTYDGLIPEEYVTELDAGYDAKGYASVWHEGTYYLPRQVVEIEAENVRKEIMEAKEKVENEKQEKLAEARKKAKETGKPVILRKWVEECIDSDEECDIDIVYEVMLPSGKIEYQGHHTC